MMFTDLRLQSSLKRCGGALKTSGAAICDATVEGVESGGGLGLAPVLGRRRGGGRAPRRRGGARGSAPPAGVEAKVCFCPHIYVHTFGSRLQRSELGGGGCAAEERPRAVLEPHHLPYEEGAAHMRKALPILGRR